jgi:hypothetical protein
MAALMALDLIIHTSYLRFQDIEHKGVTLQ